MKHKWIIYTITALALILGGFLIGKKAYNKPVEIVAQTDTLIKTDTLHIDHFIEVAKTIRDTILLPVIEFQTIVINDTTYILMPEEQVLIKDERFTAQISGVNPHLDWIDLYQQTKVITNTTTQIKKVPAKFSIGAQAGYGVTKSGLSPYIGVGVSYNLMSF